jgi:hypothetical protein
VSYGEWLARLHGGAAPVSAEASLSDRGPDHYLGLLPTARTGLTAAHAVATQSGHDCRLKHPVVSALDRRESRWERVSAACKAWPRTLVHADFTRKHVRLRQRDIGVQVLALDWETAGWGPPAADLAGVPWGLSRDRVPSQAPAAGESDTQWYGPVSLDVYASVIASFWPGVGRSEVERLSRVGSIFRVIDATCWASHRVECGGIDKGMGSLRAYADDLVQAMAALDN